MSEVTAGAARRIGFLRRCATEQGLIPHHGRGEAEVLVAFEKMEAVRYAAFLKVGGTAVINDYAIMPLPVATGMADYPQGTIEAMQMAFPVLVVPASKIAEELGNPKCMNIVLLGALVKAFHMENIDWNTALEAVNSQKAPGAELCGLFRQALPVEAEKAMISQEMLAAGRGRSAIREIFEYGRHRALLLGEENVFDFSLGNPSVPPPPEVTAGVSRLTPKQRSHVSAWLYPARRQQRSAGSDCFSLNRPFGTDFSRRNFYLNLRRGGGACLDLSRAASARSRVIALAPYFPEYASFATAAGGQLRVVEADRKASKSTLINSNACCRFHTQGVIVNSPNNPPA